MKAIILAAGSAKRLNPLTESTPKCLLSMGNKLIIDYQIEGLIKNEVNEFVMVVGFQSKKIIKHIKTTYPKETFTFITNDLYTDTGPAYSLWCANAHLSDTVLYLNADVLCHADIIKSVIEYPKETVTAIQHIPWNLEAVNVVTNDSKEIIEIGKHIDESTSCGEFIGVTKIGKAFNSHLIKVLEKFNDQEEVKKFAADSLHFTIRERGQKMHVLDVTDLPAIEIDTPVDYADAQKLIKTIDAGL